MKRPISVFALVVAALFFAFAAFSQQEAPPQGNAQNPQVIELTAKKYEYGQSVIHVKQGARVQLKFTALDRKHGFKISPYPDGAETQGPVGLEFASPQDCWKLEKGQVTTIEFVAKSPGTYSFKCCVFCGFGHKGMHGQLIVDPQ